MTGYVFSNLIRRQQRYELLILNNTTTITSKHINSYDYRNKFPLLVYHTVQ
jgi:hypothetical protein